MSSQGQPARLVLVLNVPGRPPDFVHAPVAPAAKLCDCRKPVTFGRCGPRCDAHCGHRPPTSSDRAPENPQAEVLIDGGRSCATANVRLL
jgi:hypothetical protein